MDTLAVFRSRSEALQIYSALRRAGIACSTVNTPSSLKKGCGISIVFPHSYENAVTILVQKTHAASFAGFYKR